MSAGVVHLTNVSFPDTVLVAQGRTEGARPKEEERCLVQLPLPFASTAHSTPSKASQQQSLEKFKSISTHHISAGYLRIKSEE